MPEEQDLLGKYALLAVMLTSFMVTFMFSAINLALPAIGVEFNASVIMTSWIITGYTLSVATLLLPLGHLADIIGRRKIFLLGSMSFAVISLASTLAHSVLALILWRTLQGLSGAMILGTGMAILIAVYPPQKKGQAMGLALAVTYVGLVIGPALGGIMNQQLGWRSIFYLTTFFALIASLIIWQRLRGEWVGAEGGGFDLLGSILYIIGIAAFLYGLSSISSIFWAKYAAIAGLGLLVLFVVVELKVSHPILQASLFRNQTFFFSNLAALINYSATFAVTFLLSLFLQVVVGYSSQQAGLILLAQPIIMAVFSPLFGSLSDRIEPRLLASLGMGLSAVGLLGFVFLRPDSPVWMLIILQAVMGLGTAIFVSPNNNAIMSSVQPKFYGLASSTMATMRLIGQAMSMAVVTMIISAFIGHAAFSSATVPELVSSMHTLFLVFTILCVLGVFASLARGPVRPSPTLS